MAEKSTIVKYKKPINFNIGMAAFLIIIIYVAFNIFYYLTSETISEYEVSQGAIATNNIYQGLILREEKVISAAHSGYINYYMQAGSRVAVNDVIYSIDTEGSIANEIVSASMDGTRLSESSLQKISEQIDAFVASKNNNQFYSTYTFKEDLNSEISQILNSEALTLLDKKVHEAQADNTFYKIVAGDTGIIEYYVDGYESLSKDDITADSFNAANYTKNNLFSNSEVDTSSPVYKLVTSEDWDVIVPISKELAESLSDKSVIKVRFCKDDYTVNSVFSIIQKENAYYLDLTFTTAMIRYIGDRFVDIELVQNDQTGLKIPISAITSKEFYTIPKEYFIGGDSSDGNYLLLKVKAEDGSTETVKQVKPTIYYENESYYYTDDEVISAGDVVTKLNSLETYIIGTTTDSLVGVYNINKGYAVFKQINIIYQNEEYAIVEQKTAYGISLYDHIALDGSKVTEDQLVTK